MNECMSMISLIYFVKIAKRFKDIVQFFMIQSVLFDLNKLMKIWDFIKQLENNNMTRTITIEMQRISLSKWQSLYFFPVIILTTKKEEENKSKGN